MSEPAHQILKDARKEAGLTQIQVAALLSVSVEQVKRMERGDWIPEMADVAAESRQIGEESQAALIELAEMMTADNNGGEGTDNGGDLSAADQSGKADA